MIHDYEMEPVTEADLAFHEIFETAMEASTIKAKTRRMLDDTSFGVVFTDENGKIQRKYPLRVTDDMEATRELQRKAVAFFYHCKPNWKRELAVSIVNMIAETKSGVKISPKSQINKYVDVPDDMHGEEFKF